MTITNFGRSQSKSGVFIRYDNATGQFSLSSSCHPTEAVRVIRFDGDSLPECSMCRRRIDNEAVRRADAHYIDKWTFEKKNTQIQNIQQWAAAWLGLEEHDIEVTIS